MELRRRQIFARTLARPGARSNLSAALTEAQRQIARESPIHRGWKALGPGLRRIYAAAQSAAATALETESDENLHESRKRATELLYAVEFLGWVRPAPMPPATLRAAHRLARLLGDDHDLAVLEVALGNELRQHLTRSELRELTAAIVRQRNSLQRHAHAAARVLYAATADSFVRHFHQCWKAWRHP